MTAAQPWVKWRFDKWRNDEGLRLCSLAARGLWAELLAIMHGCLPYGHLTVRGKSPTPKQIAALVGNTTEKEVTELIDELEDNGVFSRTADGVIWCRRMVRDNEARETGRNNGLRGGNPTLMREGNQERDNVESTVRDNQPETTCDANPLKGGVNPSPKDRIEIRDTEIRDNESRDARARENAKGFRLPEEWNPGHEGAQFARSLGLDPVVTFDKFRDYWAAQPGLKGRKTDWFATWRNWCRNEQTKGNGGGSIAPKAPVPRDPSSGAELPGWNF